MNALTRTSKVAHSLVETPADQYEFSTDLVTLFDKRPGEAEAIRSIRTHIMTRHIADGRRGFCLCSPDANSGCTYSAVNLAVAFSQIGVNTLLIDADMREPSVAKFIKPPNLEIGLRHLLAEPEGVLPGAVHEGVLPGLSIIYSGGVASDAPELLAGEAFKRLIDRCLRDYALTIVDTPAANTSTDSLLIASVVGYAAIVARRDVSFLREIEALWRGIQDDGAQVVGTILNEN